jgi:hypothetical protein
MVPDCVEDVLHWTQVQRVGGPGRPSSHLVGSAWPSIRPNPPLYGGNTEGFSHFFRIRWNPPLYGGSGDPGDVANHGFLLGLRQAEGAAAVERAGGAVHRAGLGRRLGSVGLSS